MKTFRELLEKKIDLSHVIVRDYGKPSPKNKIFKKDYIVIFQNQKKGEFYNAWNFDLGFEANISEDEIEYDTKAVSDKEATDFINYMLKEER